MKHEPTGLEIFLTRIAFLLYGRKVYKAFAESLPLSGDESVLDFGCGMGTVAYYAAKRLPEGHLTCLDISERWMGACRKTLRRFENVTFIKGEAPLLKIDSFDVIYCHFVLHDIPDDEIHNVIPALARSLKDGGALIFREPMKDTAKISVIKFLIEQSGLTLLSGRITDIPLMGNALESAYIKQNGGLL